MYSFYHLHAKRKKYKLNDEKRAGLKSCRLGCKLNVQHVIVTHMGMPRDVCVKHVETWPNIAQFLLFLALMHALFNTGKIRNPTNTKAYPYRKNCLVHGIIIVLILYDGQT